LIEERRNPPKNIAHNFLFHNSKTGKMLDLVGTGSALFSGGLFWRQLRFGGNWFHIIFRQIVLEAAHI
jgi:hypothetical protein